MLRITIHDTLHALTFQLEGSLSGPWLWELKKCWQDTLSNRRKRTTIVDLTGVTSIDAGGKACLTFMHRYGAEFITADCLMAAIVAEIS
jgi:ABC-type transporter Mla MlaB component